MRSDSRPNILFFLAEQHRYGYDWLGSNPAAPPPQTPNPKYLAAPAHHHYTF